MLAAGLAGAGRTWCSPLRRPAASRYGACQPHMAEAHVAIGPHRGKHARAADGMPPSCGYIRHGRLPTAVYNVVHGRVQRCPRPCATLPTAVGNRLRLFCLRESLIEKCSLAYPLLFIYGKENHSPLDSHTAPCCGSSAGTLQHRLHHDRRPHGADDELLRQPLRRDAQPRPHSRRRCAVCQ